MPEHFRALVVILVLAATVFAFARRPAEDLITHSTFIRRRNLWLCLTCLAFVSHSFWVYAGVTALVLSVARRRDPNPLALFFLLLFLFPPVPVEIPGFGLVNSFFDLTHIRVLALCILLPAFFALRKRNATLAFGRIWPDKLLLAYLLLSTLLHLRDTTLTDALRQTFYLFIDVFLPYYVASRFLKTLDDFKDAMLSFSLAVMVLALVAVFEYARHWLLYSAVIDAMGLHWSLAIYLGRGESIRAIVTTGQAIALGYVISVAIGFYLFLQGSVRSTLQRRLGALLLAAGLFAPLSRGPWIGAAAIVAVFVASGRGGLKNLMLLAVAGLLTLALLPIVPGGAKILNLLPFIGTLEVGNITYRERLIDNAWIVIQRSPWLGTVDFRSTPEMQSMIQGQGIVDVVNTYLAVALESGLIGLTFFGGFFASVLFGIRKAIRAFPDNEGEGRRLGRALLATLCGILIIIFTVSSITVIPVVYWSVAGLGVAYIQMARRHRRSESL